MALKRIIPIVAIALLVVSGARGGWVSIESKSGFFSAFAASFLLILGSEIGDKTFFIAAIMSMKHSHTVVFAGAISALVLMTILSAGMGVILPALLSRTLTHYACIILFLFFGLRLLYEVYISSPSECENEELKEVELELSASPPETESSDSTTIPTRTSALDGLKSWFSSTEKWGDRSQIATIALASSKDPIGVTFGGVFGHSLCTGLAVLGGKLLATRISERQVNFAGGCLFLFFAIASLFMGP